MKQVKLNHFCTLGYNIRTLYDMSRSDDEILIKGTDDIGGLGFIDTLKTINKLVDEFNICNRTSKEMKEFISDFNRKLKKHDILTNKHKNLLTLNLDLWQDRIENNLFSLNSIVLDHNYTLNPICA